MKKENLVQLKKVTKSDCLFLYELLSKRTSIVNISHKKMPTFEEHVKFVMSKPYTDWNIIYFKNIQAGSIYLSHQNEIGIFMKKEFQNKGIGRKAMQLLMKNNPRDRYLANINPKNKNSIEFFKKQGFKLIQHTYELSVNNET
jgi:RimJ/RimL family protein N-acetyltransferase